MDLIAPHYRVDAFARLSRALPGNDQFSQKLLRRHRQKRFRNVLVWLELTRASAAARNDPLSGG